MLGKLLKYELSATSKSLIPLFIGIIALSIVSKISIFTKNEIFTGLSFLAFGVFIFSTFIITLIIIIQRFYKNLFGDEGYLMHTLPVKPYKLILSKILSNCIFILAAIVVGGISLYILSFDEIEWSQVPTYINMFFSLASSEMGMTESTLRNVILLLPFLVFSYIIQQMLFIYASISLGSLFNKNRIALAFAFYFGIGIALNIISTIISAIIKAMDPSFLNNILPEVIVIGVSILYLIGAAIYFFITNFILTKKLNLI